MHCVPSGMQVVPGTHGPQLPPQPSEPQNLTLAVRCAGFALPGRLVALLTRRARPADAAAAIGAALLARALRRAAGAAAADAGGGRLRAVGAGEAARAAGRVVEAIDAGLALAATDAGRRRAGHGIRARIHGRRHVRHSVLARVRSHATVALGAIPRARVLSLCVRFARTAAAVLITTTALQEQPRCSQHDDAHRRRP